MPFAFEHLFRFGDVDRGVATCKRPCDRQRSRRRPPTSSDIGRPIRLPHASRSAVSTAHLAKLLPLIALRIAIIVSGTRAGLADFKIGAMYWSMASFMPSGLSAPYERPPMVVPSPNPVIPSEQTTLTIIKVCACMVATDRRCGRIIGRSTTKVSTTSTLNVEARRLEKLVVERCMIARTMRPSWPLLKGMERYHRSSGYAAAQHKRAIAAGSKCKYPPK